jgi:hypothetical protein
MTSIRKHGTPWSSSDVEELKWMVRRQTARNEMAAQLGRTEEAVQAKLYTLLGSRTAAARSTKRQQRRYNGASFFLS